MNMSSVAGAQQGMSAMSNCSGSQHGQMTSGAAKQTQDKQVTTTRSQDPTLGKKVDIAI